MATKKYQITQLQNDDSLLVLHPETDADIVSVTTGSGAYGGQATNVQDALEEVYTLAQTGGVTGVKGDSESSYRTGDVNITKANIGLGNVTNDAQIKGKASGTTQNHIAIWGTSGYMLEDGGAVITTGAPNSQSTDDTIPTSEAVYEAISNIPKPMQFKGTLGSGGEASISTLPTASASNSGYVYKVVTSGNYAIGGGYYQTADVGDMFISKGTGWVHIPSGDDVEDTWRNIKVNDTELLGSGLSTGAVNFKNGSNVTITGSGNDITIASAHPTITTQTDTSDSSTLSASGTFTAITSVTRDTNGHVTKVNTKTYTLPADSDTHNSHKVISGKKADGTTDIQSASASDSNITLGDSGITAGTYSAIQVNAKGIAVGGGQMIEVGATSQTTPSSSLAVGGLFFKEV